MRKKKGNCKACVRCPYDSVCDGDHQYNGFQIVRKRMVVGNLHSVCLRPLHKVEILISQRLSTLRLYLFYSFCLQFDQLFRGAVLEVVPELGVLPVQGVLQQQILVIEHFHSSPLQTDVRYDYLSPLKF